MKRYLTLNPSYSLRQDGNRVVLHGEESGRNHSQEWFSFIHPYYGMLLSFFSFGNLDSEEKIKKCSEFFGKGSEYIKNVISPLIDNINSVSIRTKRGGVNSFPKNLLVSSDSSIHRKDEYEVDEFEYKGLPDYETNRLDFPLSINLELVMRCYTDCCYCYADRRKPLGNMLPTNRIIELIREARCNKSLRFDINGGEVLLHPDIKIILKELKSNGFKPLVSTKIPVSKEMIDFFKEINIERFQISLDSVDERILAKMVKTPEGYLAKIRETLEYASSIGVQVDINTVLTKYNASIAQIEELLHFTSSFICVRRNRLNPMGYSLYKCNFTELAPDAKDLDLIESKISDWRKKFGIDINLSYFECASQFHEQEKLNKFPARAICTGNVWNMVILPNGDVTICEELYYKDKFIIGNLNNSSIKEVWNSKRALELYNLVIPNQSKSVCKTCHEFISCRMGKGVCWKTILMAYGEQNWDFPDPRCPKAPVPYNRFYY